ncbi:MAG: dTMP kinase [Candidatus Neomarinimicrobiota bacterium]
MFITFEGIDGSGKSEQAKRCVEYLSEKYDVLHCFDPGHTVIGNAVRAVLLDNKHKEMDATTELLLYAAARSQLVSEEIEPHLKKGGIVISDRFYDSTTAYQGYGRKLPKDLINTLNMIGAHNLVPDLCFIIDTDIEVCAQRIGKADRMEVEGREFREKVRHGYHELAKAEPERCILIDGNRSILEIHKEVINKIEEYLK